MGEAKASAATCCCGFIFFKELLILKAKIIVFDRYLYLAVESLLNVESQSRVPLPSFTGFLR